MTAPPLFARTWGDGPPVLLLHGLGASSRYWETLAEASSGYAATAPDLLGFGRSPKPRHAAYDVACHVEALAPLAAPGAVVVGHSTGAILAAALAAAHPRAVRGLLLLGLPAFGDEAVARREVGRLGLLGRLTVDGNPLARTLCVAMCRLRPLAIVVAPLVMRDLPPSIAADGALHTWVSYHRTLEQVVIGHRVAPDLRSAAVPVTLLQGDGDRPAPARYARALAEEVGATGVGVELRVVEGDHHLAVRRAEVVAAALAQLLGAAPSTPDADDGDHG
ncbi:MAG: alpha/beta fold hydrolase [Actinomycetota bacterium]|nr:alpha/beta fold hydrolase [Actinomycetota bacterium]